MRQQRLQWVGKRVGGILVFVVGFFLFAYVAIDAWVAEPSGSFESLTTAHVIWLTIGGIMIAVGHYVGTVRAAADATKRGGINDPRSSESVLSKYGYRQDPGDEDVEYGYRDGEVYAVCSECGSENDPEFDYCGNCSAEL